MDDLINELKNISSKNNDVDHLVMGNKYVPIILDKKNFHEISNEITGETNPIDLLFFDGGSCVLFESAEFCVGFIRIAGVLYSENKRKNIFKKEFYVLIKSGEKFSITTFPKNDFQKLVFDPNDASLRNGERVNCSRIVSIIRRLAEIEFASATGKDNTMVLLDGTLEARYPYEKDYLKLKNISALSKTCSLTTKNGYSITKKLLDLSENNSWFYYPVVDNNNPDHNAKIYFVKLNSNSDYVFRFETTLDEINVKHLFNALKINSNDPVFRGYPYGFVDVDMHARISEEERKMLQMKFITKAGKDWNNISKSLKSMNAHEILDNIRF